MIVRAVLACVGWRSRLSDVPAVHPPGTTPYVIEP